MERRFTNQRTEVRVEGEGDAPKKITGHGAVYYDGTPDTEYVLWDDQYGRAVERIMPGAFKNALSRPDDVRGLFNHDPNQVLGRTKSGTMNLAEDATGLRYEIQPGDTNVAKDVLAHVARGDVSGSSFAFTIPPGGQKWTSEQDSAGRMLETREITDLELYDTGPVTYPAYDKTTAGLRSTGDVTALRDEAKRAREANAAKRAEILTRARVVEIS